MIKELQAQVKEAVDSKQKTEKQTKIQNELLRERDNQLQ